MPHHRFYPQALCLGEKKHFPYLLDSLSDESNLEVLHANQQTPPGSVYWLWEGLGKKKIHSNRAPVSNSPVSN